MPFATAWYESLVTAWIEEWRGSDIDTILRKSSYSRDRGKIRLGYRYVLLNLRYVEHLGFPFYSNLIWSGHYLILSLQLMSAACYTLHYRHTNMFTKIHFDDGKVSEGL